MSLLPVNVNTGHVYGQWIDILGNPEVGSVTFSASVARIVDASAQVVIIPIPKRVPLNAEGRLSEDLVASEDTDLNPYGWTYLVREDFPGGAAPYTLTVPVGGNVDLSPLAGFSDPSTGIVTTRGVAGPPGVIWQGNWDPTPAYAVNDGVTYNGSSYRAVVARPAGSAPPDPALITPWAPLALKGSEINWRGAWTSTVAYAAKDGVYYNGSSYRAVTALAVGAAAPNPASLTPWAPVALKGDTGDGTPGAVSSVALKTGAVTLVPNDVVGLGGAATKNVGLTAAEVAAGNLTLTTKGDLPAYSDLYDIPVRKPVGVPGSSLIADPTNDQGFIWAVPRLPKKPIAGTTYTIVDGDDLVLLKTSNTAPVVVTIPTGLPVGTFYSFMQGDTGVIWFVPGTGMALRSRDDLVLTAGQYAFAQVYIDSSTAFVLTGELA